MPSGVKEEEIGKKLVVCVARRAGGGGGGPSEIETRAMTPFQKKIYTQQLGAG